MKRMKRLLIFLSVFLTLHSFGQLQVQISNLTPLVCFGGKVTLEALINENNEAITYKWLLNGNLIPDSTRKFFIINNISTLDTGNYYCVVLDTTDLRTDTSPPSPVGIRGQLHIDTLYRYNALGCPTDSNGQMKILVSGGNPPYTYVWTGGSFHQLDTL